MIDFKNRDDILPSALILLSLIILTATAIFMVVVKAPSTAGLQAKHNREKRKIITQTKRLTTEADAAEKASQPLLWSGDAQSVTSAALALMTAQTRKSGVRLVSFRPQRGQDLAGVSELRYTAQITGKYLSVQDVMSALDATGSKLALTSVDLVTSGSDAHAVSANLGISAYIPNAGASAATVVTGGAHG